MANGSGTFYFHHDALGSIANVTSATGASQWTYAYEPFGAARTATQDDPAAPTNVVKFAGETLDPTGLYHLRARDYDPAVGRFTQVDPLERARTSPLISAYLYADARPTFFVDPSGKLAVPSDHARSMALLASSGTDHFGDGLDGATGTRGFFGVSSSGNPGTANPTCPVCVIVVLAVIALGAYAVVGAGINATSESYPAIRNYPVPKEADEVLDWVVNHNGSPPPFYKGGRPYENNDDKLPPGNYREYDIDRKPPKGIKRNDRRIVVDFSKRSRTTPRTTTGRSRGCVGRREATFTSQMTEEIDWKQLLRADGEPLVLVSGTERAMDNLAGIAPADVDVRIVRGQRCHTKFKLFREWAAALQFPYYFGHNWDAYDECMDDLEWIRADRFVVFVANIDEILADEPEMFSAPFIKIVQRAVRPARDERDWSDESPALVRFIFHTHDPERTIDRLASASWGATALALPEDA